MSEQTIIKVENLKKYYDVGKGQQLKAVDNISFEIKKGSTLGVVGESGCGKSTTGMLSLNLIEPTSGKVYFYGQDIKAFNKQQMMNFRNKAQIVFQDPYSSLNPRIKVMDIIAEGMDIFKKYSKKDRNDRVMELLEMVGLKKEHAERYPHEFSGGQRQRICIARAISLNPDYIVCDEPISALDVSIQAQIVNLLNRFQSDYAYTYLFISHDIKMVKLISDRIAVMYLGKIVEIGKSEEVFNHPLHPYSNILISAVPIANPRIERNRKRIKMQGEIPSPINRPLGCVFVSRCPYAKRECHEMEPELKELENNHKIACFLY